MIRGQGSIQINFSSKVELSIFVITGKFSDEVSLGDFGKDFGLSSEHNSSDRKKGKKDNKDDEHIFKVTALHESHAGFESFTLDTGSKTVRKSRKKSEKKKRSKHSDFSRSMDALDFESADDEDVAFFDLKK